MITPTSQRLVLSRRGSTVWRVEAEDPETEGTTAYAVKVGFPSETHAHTALAPSREAHILRDISPHAVHDGTWAEGTWSVQPWHPGPSLYSKWGPHRSPESTAIPSLVDALECSAALSDLHRTGWVHGDIQPAHLIMSESGVVLIDLALARGLWVPERVDFPYRGCLVHYEAPEISLQVLLSGVAEPTPASDVYALGASLMISATGWRHVDYPDDAPREVQRQAIVDGPHRPVEIPGDLGKLVDAMLRPEPADRPTAAEACEALTHAL
ncbi:protein kinase [Streptomyces sp. NPDC012746]|uniref:protein kinase domain-containing protein n=1 Tax=Streptomyces sp. NPDC012746 TaxID=3364845 RepID=UPI0036C145EE